MVILTVRRLFSIMRGSLTAISSSTPGAIMAKRQELNVSLRYVSSRVASEILGVQAQTLRRWAKAGKIGAIRTPGNQWRYDLSGLIVAPAPAPAAPPQPKKPRATRKEPLQVAPAQPAQLDLVEMVKATPPPAVISAEALRAQIEGLTRSSRW
jgi:excisionase family DNA binding protein